jgi:hypothetical protein
LFTIYSIFKNDPARESATAALQKLVEKNISLVFHRAKATKNPQFSPILTNRRSLASPPQPANAAGWGSRSLGMTIHEFFQQARQAIFSDIPL